LFPRARDGTIMIDRSIDRDGVVVTMTIEGLRRARVMRVCVCERETDE